MENASKALIIAGGILISIMILSLLVYVATSISDMAESQDRKLAAQQIQEFNKSYLAYSKTRMYGTDVITVVNKAINHNKTIGATEVDPYYINIKIETIQDFRTTGMIIDNSLPYNHKDYKEDNISVDKIKEIMGLDEITIALNAGNYNLGHWSNDGTLQMNKGIINFFNQEKVDKVEKIDNKIYYLYSALTNFKTAIFTCVDIDGDGKAIDYNEEGRVKSMEFRQISID